MVLPFLPSRAWSCLLKREPQRELNHPHVVRLVVDLAERRVVELRARRRRPLDDVEHVQDFEANGRRSTAAGPHVLAHRQVDVVAPR